MVEFDLISYVLLPILIFLARVADVSVATVKLMFVVNNVRKIAAVLGFLEAFITIVALSRVMQDASNIVAFLMYAGGFATGTYVGMWIEEKMAYGSVVVRMISKDIPEDLFSYLTENQYRYSFVDANDQSGNTRMLFTVCQRKNLRVFLNNLETLAPQALYTIEAAKQVSSELLPEQNPVRPIKIEKVLSAFSRGPHLAYSYWKNHQIFKI